MFYCSSGGSEPLSGSKTDIVRGIITEKLTTAARDILAAVEKVISDYEAEASGFREEIQRQKVQLELLQPRVKEEPKDNMEITQSFGSFFNTKYAVKEEIHTNFEGVESQSVTEQDYDMDSRFSTPTCQTDVVRSLDSPIDLRICFLNDWKIETISKKMMKSLPFQLLQCPAGLQEAEFFSLLRSSFPLLAADGPYDFFVTNKSGKLQLLTVGSMTPEQVYGAAGTSDLYLRPKLPERVQAQGDDAPASPSTRFEGNLRKRSQRRITTESLIDLEVRLLEESCSAAAFPHGCEKFQLHQLKCSAGLKEEEFVKLLKSTFPQLAEDRPFTVLADQGRRKPPVEVDRLTPEDICRSCCSTKSPTIYIQLEETPPQEGATAPAALPSTSHPTTPEMENLVNLKICILDGPSSDVTPPSEFQSQQIIELLCPRNLGELEFFTLLRATFPLLEDKDFDLLTGHGSKVSPIRVKNLTPEKINHITTSAGGSVLYVRLQEQQNAQESDEEVQSRLSPTYVQESTSTSRQEDTEDNSANHRTKDETSAAPVRRMEEKRVHRPNVRKSRQLEGDETEDSEDSDGSDVLTRVSSHCLSTAYKPDRPRSPPPKVEEEEQVHLLHKDVLDDDETEDSEDGDDTDSVSTRLSTQKPLVSNPKAAQNPEPASVKEVPVKAISQDTAKDDGQGSRSTRDGPSSPSPPTSDHRSGRNEGVEPMEVTEREGVTNPNGQVPRRLGWSCRLCRLHHGTKRMLVRHAWTHIGDVKLLCGVCGDQSHSSHALRTHLQTHQKVFACKICTKVFLSIRGFEEHKERHKGHTSSHRCRVCSQTFTNASELQKHKEVHADEPQGKCETCQRSFNSSLKLKLHLLTHKGIKQGEPGPQ
uniref:C2H2-type domain-containing protein n=1 Tax=Nothobranchius furzeri TaxID=105023 RepID=A0A1A8VES9_NOTFU